MRFPTDLNAAFARIGIDPTLDDRELQDAILSATRAVYKHPGTTSHNRSVRRVPCLNSFVPSAGRSYSSTLTIHRRCKRS